MSERFLKFIPSNEALHLARKHPRAFVLLMFIAERARRENGSPDGLTIGQCHIGDWESMGFTRQEYRTALNILIVKKYIEKVETCRTRQKSTNGSTTIGTLVRLCDSRIYDINIEDTNHRSNHRPTTDQPPTNHEQEGLRRIKNQKKSHPSIPSGRDEGMTDDFFSKGKREILPGIFLSEEEFEACIRIKGDEGKVKSAIAFIQKSPKRKTEILDWPNALDRWKIPDEAKVRLADNFAFAKKLCMTFCDFKKANGWKCSMYRDKKKDQTGILFESQSPYQESVFISFSDGEFEKKCEENITKNNMKAIT